MRKQNTEQHLRTRRTLFLGAAALPLMAALAACTVTSNNGATSFTLDVNRIVTDGEAILAAAGAALAAPAVVTVLGANYVAAQAALAAGNAALAQIQALTGGNVTVTVDTSKVQSLVTSLLSSAQTVLNLVQGGVSKLTGATATKVQNYVAAALALIPLVQVAAQLSAIRATKPTMTEEQALKLAHS